MYGYGFVPSYGLETAKVLLPLFSSSYHKIPLDAILWKFRAGCMLLHNLQRLHKSTHSLLLSYTGRIHDGRHCSTCQGTHICGMAWTYHSQRLSLHTLRNRNKIVGDHSVKVFKPLKFELGNFNQILQNQQQHCKTQQWWKQRKPKKTLKQYIAKQNKKTIARVRDHI